MDGSVRVTVPIMIPLEGLERVQPLLTWKYQNMNLLMQTQLKLDKKYLL